MSAERLLLDVIDSVPAFLKAVLPVEAKCEPPSLLAYNLAGVGVIVTGLLALHGLFTLFRAFY